MAYKILLLPKPHEALTINEALTIKALQGRFWTIGFRIDTEKPIASRSDLEGSGRV